MSLLYLNSFQAPSDTVSNGILSPLLYTYGTVLSMGINMVVALFILFPVVERTSGSKHLQLMTGLSPATFWLINLFWDFLIYIVSGLLMVGILMAMDYQSTFTTYQAPGL